MPCIVAPSLLAADFLNLQKEIEMINRSEADWLHLDIMDGVFVPNISFGFPVMEQVAAICKKPLDAHFMIVEPQKFITQAKACHIFQMNVHYEACTHLHRTIWEIRESGMQAAVTLNPHTPVEVLEDIIQDVNMVLLMSVNPGFGGQKFIPHSLGKVRRLKEMIVRKGLNTLIQIDGGVAPDTGKLLVEAGADVLVAGNSVFRASDPELVIRQLKQLK